MDRDTVCGWTPHHSEIHTSIDADAPNDDRIDDAITALHRALATWTVCLWIASLGPRPCVGCGVDCSGAPRCEACS